MQQVLQKYTLHTCCESAQSGPPVVCFHLVRIEYPQLYPWFWTSYV
jgi:hypothetical protein